jgi:hypothetical protein
LAADTAFVVLRTLVGCEVVETAELSNGEAILAGALATAVVAERLLVLVLVLGLDVEVVLEVFSELSLVLELVPEVAPEVAPELVPELAPEVVPELDPELWSVLRSELEVPFLGGKRNTRSSYSAMNGGRMVTGAFLAALSLFTPVLLLCSS